jgi:hypothetical protein
LPVGFNRFRGASDGLGNVELESYWNFCNDRQTGRAYGVGFNLGLPATSQDVGDKALIYEPFFVVYRQFGEIGFNASAGLEVKNFLNGEKTELEGDIALAAFRKVGPFVPLIELGLQVEEEKTELRLAPGLYWHPRWMKPEIGVSFPIGMTPATPNFGAWLLITWEFNNKEADAD